MIVKKMIFIYMYTIINDNPFENLKKRKCVKNCDFNEMLKKICIIKYLTNKIKTNEEEIKVQDIILETIEEGFISDNYGTSNLEKGKDEIIYIIIYLVKVMIFKI